MSFLRDLAREPKVGFSSPGHLLTKKTTEHFAYGNVILMLLPKFTDDINKRVKNREKSGLPDDWGADLQHAGQFAAREYATATAKRGVAVVSATALLQLDRVTGGDALARSVVYHWDLGDRWAGHYYKQALTKLKAHSLIRLLGFVDCNPTDIAHLEGADSAFTAATFTARRILLPTFADFVVQSALSLWGFYRSKTARRKPRVVDALRNVAVLAVEKAYRYFIQCIVASVAWHVHPGTGVFWADLVVAGIVATKTYPLFRPYLQSPVYMLLPPEQPPATYGTVGNGAYA